MVGNKNPLPTLQIHTGIIYFLPILSGFMSRDIEFLILFYKQSLSLFLMIGKSNIKNLKFECSRNFNLIFPGLQSFVEAIESQYFSQIIAR